MTATHLVGDGAIVTSDQHGTAGPDDAELSSDDAALGADERAELERLRAEVADLRAQASAAPAVVPPTVVAPTPRRRQRWRSVVATLLIVIACILAPLAGVAIWRTTSRPPRR